MTSQAIVASKWKPKNTLKSSLLTAEMHLVFTLMLWQEDIDIDIFEKLKYSSIQIKKWL